MRRGRDPGDGIRSTMNVTKLLIANRGEIAVRIARAAADTGLPYCRRAFRRRWTQSACRGHLPICSKLHASQNLNEIKGVHKPSFGHGIARPQIFADFSLQNRLPEPASKAIGVWRRRRTLRCSSCRAVLNKSAGDPYNGTLDRARNLAGGIVEAAQEAFDAKSEKWQASDKGVQVRSWIEQWEMSLDDVDLDLPEVDPEAPAGALGDASPIPTT
jgi:hypothetical protein